MAHNAVHQVQFQQMQQLNDECEKAGRNRDEIDVAALTFPADKSALARGGVAGKPRLTHRSR